MFALFTNPRFTAASVSVAISFFALSGFIFVVTQYFQFVKDFTPLGTGVRLLPVAGSVAVTSVVGTKLAVRIGNKVIVGLGLVLFAIGLLWASTSSGTTPYFVIVGQMLFLGSGMGLTSAPATEAIMGVVPAAKAGVGSAVNDATRLFGGTLGVAVIGSVAASLYASRLTSTLPAHLPARAVTGAKGSVGGAIVASHELSRLRPRPCRPTPHDLRHQRIPLQPGGRLSGCWCRHHRGGSDRYCVPAGPAPKVGGDGAPFRSALLFVQ